MRSLAVLLLATLPAVADRAEAQKLAADGQRLMQKQDFAGAAEAFTRAIEADPQWAAPWAARGQAKMLRNLFAPAVEDYSRAIALEPTTIPYYLLRTQVLMAMDHWTETLEDADAILKVRPESPEGASLRGWALVHLGDVDRGLADQDRAFQWSRSNPAFRVRHDGYMKKADWAALASETEIAMSAGAARPGLRFFRIVALVELGKLDEARQAVEDARSSGTRGEAEMGEAWLLGTPGARHDPARALEILKGVPDPGISYFTHTQARALLLSGRAEDCVGLLATRARHTNFESQFWLGAALWTTGRLPEARAALRDARRLNPYFLRHAERIEGLRDFAVSVDRELQEEGGDHAALSREQATHLLTLAEIEALVRRFLFSRAVAEFEKLVPSLASQVRRAEAEARLAEVRGMAAAHRRLVGQVGTLKLAATVAKTELALTKADEEAFDFSVKGGSGRFPWACLDTAIYVDFALKSGLTAEEKVGVGCLAWDAGRRDTAAVLFEEATRKDPALRPRVASFVCRRRGIAATEVVLFRGAYVSPAEKENLEKGLVPWQGGWVPAKDRDQLARGLVKVGDQWVAGKEADLLQRGFRRHKDQWLSREDYEALRQNWSDCWVEETAHFVLKTNHSEAFAKDLAAVAEPAWEALKAHLGAEPKGARKLELHAFRTYEDYRRFCVERKAEDFLAASGFARSDSDVAAGWDKTGNARLFLQTMVHEAAHLFYFRAVPSGRPPSWMSEGFATAFEGFRWDGRRYDFTLLSDARLPLVREAAAAGRHIPLRDLVAGEALPMIQKDPRRALLFYAECWSLYFFLSQTSDKAHRAAWSELRKAADAGRPANLLDHFKDPARLESDWVQFVKGL